MNFLSCARRVKNDSRFLSKTREAGKSSSVQSCELVKLVCELGQLGSLAGRHHADHRAVHPKRQPRLGPLSRQ